MYSFFEITAKHAKATFAKASVAKKGAKVAKAGSLRPLRIPSTRDCELTLSLVEECGYWISPFSTAPWEGGLKVRK
jgi:hypothetical protein